MKKRKREALIAAAQRAVNRVPLYNPTSETFTQDANTVLHRVRMQRWERDRAEHFRQQAER